MEYKIVHDTEAERLERIVNDMIAEGWELLGAPFVYHHNATFYQAMIRQKPILNDPMARSIASQIEGGGYERKD